MPDLLRSGGPPAITTNFKVMEDGGITRAGDAELPDAGEEEEEEEELTGGREVQDVLPGGATCQDDQRQRALPPSAHFVSGADIRRQMVASMSKDDRIISGSLKLSFMRIATVRKVHSQLCPVCENVLDWRELIIDGFFAEILKTTPDSVDDVLVEADGEWSTANGKHSSAPAAKVADGTRYDYIDSDGD
ncbi:hypothetical protein B0H14DRAFT_2588127 [Mycena olivaceomarginata]|nr:hypothetical protein B0H14DRAFT_2588127 [Mycena olivaceomarginata]